MSTFDFSNLCTKIPHDKLLAVLNSVIEFAFRSGARHTICVLNNKAYWIKNNSQMNGNRYSLKSLKQAVKYLVENGPFKVGTQLFFANYWYYSGFRYCPTLFQSIFISLTILTNR